MAKPSIRHWSEMNPELQADIKKKGMIWCMVDCTVQDGKISPTCTGVPEWEFRRKDGIRIVCCSEHARRYCAKNELRLPASPVAKSN